MQQEPAMHRTSTAVTFKESLIPHAMPEFAARPERRPVPVPMSRTWVGRDPVMRLSIACKRARSFKRQLPPAQR